MQEQEKNAQARGRLIVFEGIDGAGKTTQIELLTRRLQAEGRRVYRTAEPTESVTGGLLRDALGGITKRTPGEMAALFVLDRIFHNTNPVNGFETILAQGVDIICDRYYYSSLAYQGCETDEAWVRDMNLNCPDIRRPDICIFLDLTPQESMERIGRGRVTVEIYENEERLTRVRNRFMSVIEDLKDTERICVVNAARSVEEIHEEIAALVAEIL
ncbi:MAG: dTMP kinase [Ruminococcaceae bacterium]|nr:dTMP kinase [Oscillospiraceae bacterium]